MNENEKIAMENQQTQRLLYDNECKNCNNKTVCEWADTPQCCREITNKLRVELKNNRKHREIIAKISISTEYIFNHHRQIKTVVDTGIFTLKEPYIFGEPFLRAEIQGKCNGGTFSTKYFKWDK